MWLEEHPQPSRIVSHARPPLTHSLDRHICWRSAEGEELRDAEAAMRGREARQQRRNGDLQQAQDNDKQIIQCGLQRDCTEVIHQ